MEDQRTCGKGLAEHAALPAVLGDVMASVARVLEVHTRALDLTDENSKKEHDAYARLMRDHRAIAAELTATAQRMAGYRDLPMGRHDEASLATPEAFEAFETFVRLEHELVEHLKHRLERDRTMLREMGDAHGA